MSIFDELVARYRNMNYGNLSGNNPSAVRSLLEEYNDRTYAQIINPSELTYLNGVPQNQWIIDDRGNLVFGMPGMEGGLIGSGSTYPTYDPNIDYGDPGYAGFIPGEITGELQQGLIGEAIQRGGGRNTEGGSNIGFEKINNSWYRIDRKTGEVTKTDPKVPGLIGMAIDAMPNQNISNMLDRMESQYGLNVRDQVVRGMIDHPDFTANPHTDVSLSSERTRSQRQPGLFGETGTDSTTSGSDATTGGFDPSTQVGYDTDGDGIADRAVTDTEGNPVTFGDLGDTVGNQDDGEQGPPSDRQPGLFGGQNTGGGWGGNAPGGFGAGAVGCFVKGTMIEMANNTEKEITSIDVGEEIKGGTVLATMKFLPTKIYDYKGVKVSGSHWVIEDNQFIEVENSKHGILTDLLETVYCFKTSENRIWINGIEFGDFETGSDKDWEPHFEAVKEKLNKELRNG